MLDTHLGPLRPKWVRRQTTAERGGGPCADLPQTFGHDDVGQAAHVAIGVTSAVPGGNDWAAADDSGRVGGGSLPPRLELLGRQIQSTDLARPAALVDQEE